MHPPRRQPAAALLILADGRFPAGGYAHSGGLEPAIAHGSVRTVAELELFVVGRLVTVGLVAASFAAATCRLVQHHTATNGDERVAWRTALDHLDAELDARTPSPAQREISRQLGRQLVHALAKIAPSAHLEALGRTPHQPIALGAAYAELGLGPDEAALACLHETAAGPVAAAVRLLSVDPFATYAVLARLAPAIDELTRQAVEASTDVRDLPTTTAPLLDSGAECHRRAQTRLFAS